MQRLIRKACSLLYVYYEHTLSLQCFLKRRRTVCTLVKNMLVYLKTNNETLIVVHTKRRGNK